MPAEILATPGVDRVVRFQVAGKAFGFRRPSRADVREAWNRYVAKLFVVGIAGETDLTNAYDGAARLWEARLEVGLVPRRAPDGTEKGLGETAPPDWLDGGAVSFDLVDVEEFDAVVAHLQESIEKKTSPPVGTNSTSSALGSISG